MSQSIKTAIQTLESTLSFWRDAERGIRSDGQLIADALNAGMLEDTEQALEALKKEFPSGIIEKHFDKETIVPERDTFDGSQVVKELFEKAMDLHNSHINNGGTLDYPEKEYGWLADELEDVQVGYLKDDTVDSDYANRLREEGFTMTEEEAAVVLQHRITEINSYFN